MREVTKFRDVWIRDIFQNLEAMIGPNQMGPMKPNPNLSKKEMRQILPELQEIILHFLKRIEELEEKQKED